MAGGCVVGRDRKNRLEYVSGPDRIYPHPVQKRGQVHFMSQILHVSDDSFEKDVLQSDDAVLVEYWAEWCGPCKMIAPVLNEIADENAGKLKVCKVDVDANPDVHQKFGIRGIPTLILFKGGNAEATKVGALSKSQLAEFVAEAI